MTRRLVPLCSALFLACLAAASAHAGGPGRWDVLVAGANAPAASAELGVARVGGTLHVAWSESFSAVRTRAISAAGQPGPTITVVDGWGVSADPTLLAEGAGLRAFFSAGTPIEGLLNATAPAAGSPWSAPALVVNDELVRARTVGATRASDGTPLQTWYTAGDIATHRGLAGGPVFTFQAPGTNSRPNIVTESSGTVLVSWCSFGATPSGTFVRRVDPASGAPAGPAVQLPGSTTDYQGQTNATCVLESEVSRREPMVARPGGGVFVAGTAGYPTLERVIVWRLDAAGAVAGTLAAAAAKNVPHAEPAVDAGPDGRIWVAWLEPSGSGREIVARRSNRAATVLGAPVTAVPPGGISAGTVNLSAQTGRVDVLAIVGAVGTGAKSLQHTQLLPGLTFVRRHTAKRRGGGAVTFAVLDAGEPVRGVRIRAGRASGVTGAGGTATLVLRRGPVRAVASKAGYTSASLAFRCC